MYFLQHYLTALMLFFNINSFKMNTLFNVMFTNLIIGLIVLTVNCQRRCDQIDLCSCKMDDGSILDLTSLGNTDNTPRFKDVQCAAEMNFYSFNPCQPFTEKSCTDAAVCILNSDLTESISIGDAAKAAFQYNQEQQAVIVAYTSGTIVDLKLSEIVLKCDESACTPSIVANGQQSAGDFQLTLTTVCACPNGCDAKGPKRCKYSGAGSLSAGSYLCIIFFSVIILYLIGGLIFMKFVRKKDGIEIFPHITFWRSVPVLVQSGAKFTVSKVTRKEATYNTI
ncbi:uncharacterized protein LOC127854433 [Dreissena polymorpha]|nr:uncharacterized protein LOC127854433 [Dreissena polymorpha]